MTGRLIACACAIGIALTAGAGFASQASFEFQGQLSGWTRWSQDQARWAHNQNRWDHNSGIRYLPGIFFEQRLGETARLAMEVSLDFWLAGGSAPDDDTSEAQLYRAAGWFSTTRTETMLGLQKITFGPARLLRPLQWFDRIDPSDPLGLTRGVYGLRFRYLAQNNASGWLWCLYPNDDNDPEQLPTRDDVPQWGGRLEIPALSGELAVSLNLRQVEEGAEPARVDFSEERLGLDGRWDLGTGLWFEAVVQHRSAGIHNDDWTKMIMAGADYTFDWGNGLYVLVEQMAAAASGTAWAWQEERWISAVMLGYPLSIFDTLQFIGFYDWQAGRSAAHVQWQRTYDRVVFNVALFDYPSEGLNSAGTDQPHTPAGTGAMLMIIFNH